jgi:hypothetical protein
LTAYPITSKYFRHQLFKCEGYIRRAVNKIIENANTSAHPTLQGTGTPAPTGGGLSVSSFEATVADMNKDKSINAGDVVLSGKVVYSDDSISSFDRNSDDRALRTNYDVRDYLQSQVNAGNVTGSNQ